MTTLQDYMSYINKWGDIFFGSKDASLINFTILKQTSNALGVVVVVIIWHRWIYNYLCNQCLSPLKL